LHQPQGSFSFLPKQTERTTLRPRGFDLPFKITDYLAGAVPNSYPKLDLLWDNVIAGP
jgi:hypothetical protein